jgi:hemolysin activation/secretion protein
MMLPRQNLLAAISVCALVATSAFLPKAASAAESGKAPAAPPRSVAQAAKPAPSQAPVVISSLVFVNDSAAVAKQGLASLPTAPGNVSVVGLPFLDNDEFRRTVAAHFLDKPLTNDTLTALVRETVLFSRGAGNPVVDVFVPEQEVPRGILQVVVRQGVLGQVKVQGNRYFDSASIAGELRTRPGEPILSQRMDPDLAWLNNNPFRSVNALYAAGEKPGTTDIILDTTDRFPLRPYLTYSNDGVKATNENVYGAGFTYGNVLGLGHILDFQYAQSVSPAHFRSYATSYTVPLPWRDQLVLTAQYSTSVAETLSAFKTTGDAIDISGRYVINLPQGNFRKLFNLTHQASFGYEYRRLSSDLAFGGTSVFTSKPEVDQFVGNYTAALKDPYGSTNFDGSLFGSPGGLTGNNTDAAFSQARFGAPASYVYTRLRLERTNALPLDFTLVGRGTAQFTDSPLLASERLGYGGARTVRGYDESIFLGDKGYQATVEIRTPSVSPLALVGVRDISDSLQFLTFFDYGLAQQVHRTAGFNDAVLASYGAGLRYTIAPYLTARFDYGIPLRNVAGQHFSGRPHVGIVLGY